MTVDGRNVVNTKLGGFWNGMLTDVRHALRGVRRTPGLTVAVILTLGLGIGVNAAMFSVVDRVLLRAPEHVVQPEMVRRVFRDGDFFGQRMVMAATTYPDIRDLRTIPEFASVGAATTDNSFTLGTGENARKVLVTRATYDFFETLGVQAHRGRFFDAAEDRLGAPLTAVVGYECWQSMFAGDANIVGRTLEVAGKNVTVIGIAPEGFTGIGLERVDFWLPAIPFEQATSGSDDFADARTELWLGAVVRLRSDADITTAEAKATGLYINNREPGRSDPAVKILTAPLIQAHGPDASAESKVSLWLAGVSLIVLLIACANVANLLLAQGSRRRREIAVRLTLGVSRGRLLREMTLETLLLAGMGGVVALMLAHWGSALIRSVLIPDVLWSVSPLSGRVVTVTVILSLAAGVLAGFGPAVQSTAADLTRDLGDGGRGSSRRRTRMRDALTIAQATLSTVLLVGAGLFIRSVIQVQSVDMGMDVDHLIQVSLEFQGEDPDVVETTRLYAEAMDAVRGMPGVDAVAGSNMLFQWAAIENIRVPGLDSLPIPAGGGPFISAVTPGYLKTMGIRLLQGRPIQDTDVEGAPLVAVVNQTMATALWPGRDPLGQCFYVASSEACTTVVGVMAVASRGNLEHGPLLAYQIPLAQTRQPPAGLYLHSQGDARELAATVAPVLRSFSARVRFADVQPFGELLGPQTRAWTLGASLFTTFGILALILAAIGLYSLLAFEVARKTKELGIRAALGAPGSRVLRDVVFAGARLAALGVLMGLGVSVIAGRYVENLLFQVDAADPLVLASVALVLLLVGVIASTIPGLRATRVDPMTALRAE